MPTPTDVGRWIRLDHHGLGMPTPAVYVQRADLGELDVAGAGFIRTNDPVMRTNMPMSRRLAADVMTAPEQVSLKVFTKDMPLSPKRIVKATPDHVLQGLYLDPADERWQNEAYVATRILLVTGSQPADGNTPAMRLLFDSGSLITGVPLTAIAPPES